MKSAQYTSNCVKRYSTSSHRRFHRTYDGLGRRAFRAAYSGATVTDRTFYGYYKNYLIEEKTESFTSTGVLDGNSITKNYIYGPNGEDDIALVIQKYVKKVGVTITTTTTNYYYHKDHLSSPEKISNDLGAIIEEYAYTPYGATFIKNSSTSGSYIPVSVYMSTILPKIPAGNTGALYGNNRLYTGREYDKESGLYYNRARYYDSTHGRFLSRDPIGYIDDVNPYRYVGNDPMMFSDPSGLKSKPIGVWSKFKNFNYNLIGGNSKLEYYAGLGSNLLLETIEGIPQIPFVIFGGNQLNPGESVGQSKAMEGYYEGKIGQEKGELSTSILGSIFVAYKGASIMSQGGKMDGILGNPEVQNTLKRIKKGEPKYSGKDGEDYINDGRRGGELLPKKDDGYYKEWTVDTPGINHRGEQRIVVGKEGEIYFTDNHYQNFTNIK